MEFESRNTSLKEACHQRWNTKVMEGLPRNFIGPLAHGSLAEGGATVDSHLIELCRPHHKPPSALLPVATYRLPLPPGGAQFRTHRKLCDIHFGAHDPSVLLACTNDNTLLFFDMNAGAFYLEIQLSAEREVAGNSVCGTSCVHVNRCPDSPLIFCGSPNGDILLFDARVSGLNAKFSGRRVCPTLRIPAAHDGPVCGIRTGLALHPHLFLTGGREDRWIRLFDLRFPFHYSSGSSSGQNSIPYPLEATRLGPSEDSGLLRSSLMAFDVSPDGAVLAASVVRYSSGQPLEMKSILERGDGETVLLSLPDGTRALKTIASADACAAEYIEFSPNGKYILQTGGVSSTHCRLCWQCSCRCSCRSHSNQESLIVGVDTPTKSIYFSVPAFDGDEKDPQTIAVPSMPLPNGLSVGEMPQRGPLSRQDLQNGHQCTYHRAQLVNIVQSNRTVSLKSPADSTIAFTDAFCISHCPEKSEHPMDSPLQVGPPSAKEISTGHCGPSLESVVAGNCGVLPQLKFTLHGPQSRHAQTSRHRFWEYLSHFQRLTDVQKRGIGVASKRAREPAGPPLEQPETEPATKQIRCPEGLSKVGTSPPPFGGRENNVDCHLPEVSHGSGLHASGAHQSTKSVLFPLLHPQLSQFIAACGPLHPAFVRAEGATFPFTCRLWGGLVVGFGGSTADHTGRRRLYDGLKLWDSTTGVVLSWAEGPLASEGALRCLQPIPDVSTGLLATGGSILSAVGSPPSPTPAEGVTFWSLKRRDDLLVSALNGTLSLEVELEDNM
ncbi:hypothetical protein cyc_06819 [Cyclospora cayetanensis]|uniref:Uncharacterized protein n=1 Tax=Cyclospora cayetanensis TaxID=88456 RepID=A0A1D3D8U0_9EIME|nr:hypothetical protein cyc_06819 [Cyclospora cayetanensis]